MWITLGHPILRHTLYTTLSFSVEKKPSATASERGLLTCIYLFIYFRIYNFKCILSFVYVSYEAGGFMKGLSIQKKSFVERYFAPYLVLFVLP